MNPKKPKITKFGYSGHPNNQIFGYLGHLGDPNNQIQRTESPKEPNHLNAPKFSDNCPKPLWSLAKNGISLEGIIIFLEKILAKTPNPELLQSIPGLHV
jgi:hypothetical protein